MAIKTVSRTNPAWRRFLADHALGVMGQPVLSRRDHFFLMGSCFAEEIRRALETEIGPAQVGPDYRAVRFDPARASVDALPDHNHLNTYNAFSVLQEIERILGLWTPAPEDCWQVNNRLQCPYRRLVFADTPETFAEVCAELDRVLREGFAAADHFIFTFGMTEVFLNKASGKVANQKPGCGLGGGATETTFHQASFAENLTAALRLIDLIQAAKPQARIFVTVSPVPLKRTFSGQDVAVANTPSKATLRAVLAEAAAARPNVHYFPSYEAVIAEDREAWEEDGRHVRRPLV